MKAPDDADGIIDDAETEALTLGYAIREEAPSEPTWRRHRLPERVRRPKWSELMCWVFDTDVLDR